MAAASSRSLVCKLAASRSVGRSSYVRGLWIGASTRVQDQPMAANISIECPGCGKTFGLRFDPGPENAAPMLAKDQLTQECPDHEGKKWEFWDRIR